MHKNILIPHLGFMVQVRPRPKDWGSYASVLYDENWENSVRMILPDTCTPSALAHELVHVLQQIARYTKASFSNESEHYSYIMQWLMEQIQKEQRRVRAKKRGGRRVRRSRKT